MGARKQRVVCSFCGWSKLEAGEPFCVRCDQPTEWASYDERVRWELAQWNGSRDDDAGAYVNDSERGRRSLLRGLRRSLSRSNGSAPVNGGAPANGNARADERPSEIVLDPPVIGPRATANGRHHSPASRVSKEQPGPDEVAAILAELASYASVAGRDPEAEAARTRDQIRHLESRLAELEAGAQRARG